ncbi:DNA-binding response regulator [Alteromonas sediminis]|uniref:DNA-binding response regulator n=1 Tax=Alteromonas sediminis TaxID=2259342 RepID=A0A3N5Y8Q7_9ALTE|nr:LytTR family DNA-binding domain-containing protein [Alteromonas sediminis]RPJ67539.1 DNA-binding response regulator [Alteromonas sediminis]
MQNNSGTIKVIVVDDEPLARKGLRYRLEEHKDIEIITECSTGQEAVHAIMTHLPDVVFLDIQMPELNGFQVVAELKKTLTTLPIILFVTAYDAYAIKAFEIHALDYLLKPADDERIAEALDRVRASLKQQNQSEQSDKLINLVAGYTGQSATDVLEKLANDEPVESSPYSDTMAIKDGSEVTRVPVDSILWIDAAGDYMCVHAKEGMHIMRKTMKELEKELNPNVFVRVHRSAIVNINFVKKMVSHVSGEYHLILQNETELKVSRSHRDKVKAAMHS